ncbi:hypothetical protein CB1_000602040 [Camelus ferus]|nr:hypothetical protein CB1_000602040 [Camelus ferus]
MDKSSSVLSPGIWKGEVQGPSKVLQFTRNLKDDESISQPSSDFRVINTRLQANTYTTDNPAALRLSCLLQTQATRTNAAALSSTAIPQAQFTADPFWKSCPLVHGRSEIDWLFLSQHHGVDKAVRTAQLITKISSFKIQLHTATHGEQSLLLEYIAWLLVEDEKEETMGILRGKHMYLEGRGETFTNEEKCEIKDLEDVGFIYYFCT